MEQEDDDTTPSVAAKSAEGTGLSVFGSQVF
jgi:hypothetical protein